MEAEEIKELRKLKYYIDGAAIAFNIQDGTRCQIVDGVQDRTNIQA
jgi:hypothetical protein